MPDVRTDIVYYFRNGSRRLTDSEVNMIKAIQRIHMKIFNCELDSLKTEVKNGGEKPNLRPTKCDFSYATSSVQVPKDFNLIQAYVDDVVQIICDYQQKRIKYWNSFKNGYVDDPVQLLLEGIKKAISNRLASIGYYQLMDEINKWIQFFQNLLVLEECQPGYPTCRGEIYGGYSLENLLIRLDDLFSVKIKPCIDSIVHQKTAREFCVDMMSMSESIVSLQWKYLFYALHESTSKIDSDYTVSSLLVKHQEHLQKSIFGECLLTIEKMLSTPADHLPFVNPFISLDNGQLCLPSNQSDIFKELSDSKSGVHQHFSKKHAENNNIIYSIVLMFSMMAQTILFRNTWNKVFHFSGLTGDLGVCGVMFNEMDHFINHTHLLLQKSEKVMNALHHVVREYFGSLKGDSNWKRNARFALIFNQSIGEFFGKSFHAVHGFREHLHQLKYNELLSKAQETYLDVKRSTSICLLQFEQISNCIGRQFPVSEEQNPVTAVGVSYQPGLFPSIVPDNNSLPDESLNPDHAQITIDQLMSMLKRT